VCLFVCVMHVHTNILVHACTHTHIHIIHTLYTHTLYTHAYKQTHTHIHAHINTHTILVLRANSMFNCVQASKSHVRPENADSQERP
jgi:hypothetical protein